MNWETLRDEIGFIHWLDIADDVAVKVEKTNGGDYMMSVLYNDDPCGGDVEYFATLAQAKTFAEKIAASGEWQDYAL